MPPAPLPANERRRLSALIHCNVLDTVPEAAFDDLTHLATELCDTPIALVSLIDTDRQWFKSRVGLDAEQTPRDLAFCGYAILGTDALVIEDATKDPRTVDNALVTGEPGIRFYAGVPLRLSSGEALGTLCVIDTKPRKADQRLLDRLHALAAQAAAQLELRHKIDALEQANGEIRDASESKSAFLAEMSHEVRTPMTAILGFADLLATDDEFRSKPEQANEAIGVIQRNAQHLLSVINDILDLSKLEAGKISFDAVTFDPAAVIEGVISLLSPQAREKGVALDVRYGNALPNQVVSDPTRLRQILLNVTGNALKFTDSGKVVITCPADSDTESLNFSITDTGIGMTPEQLERVRCFDAFTQADASTTRKFGGTGLGLRISHMLAQVLGGGLWIDSEPGVGTTTTFSIATWNGQASATLTDTDGVATQSLQAEVLADRRILIAEDGADNQLLIGYMLRRAGAATVFANTGQEALDLINDVDEAPFDLVLMDMRMPELDGYEATHLLREQGSSLPIVALTANAMAGDQERCLNAGCDAFLTKPLDRQQLIETCRAACAQLA
ncbi:MAG: ATP-binding protein [Planctomycetota bacterium]